MRSGLETKKDFREYSKKIRKSSDIPKLSAMICENIAKQDFYRQSLNIIGFFPINNEVDLTQLYKDDSKNWFLPSIREKDKKIFVHPYKHGDKLQKNRICVPEPTTPCLEDLSIMQAVLIPALAADKRGFRIGYGAGYYDRFLPGLNLCCIKIIPIFSELFFAEVPFDELDIPADYVVTEFEVYKAL